MSENHENNENNGMKKTFLVGLALGVVISQFWRPLAKTGIKTGIRVGRKVKELSQQAMEDLNDMAAEAGEEIMQEDQQKVEDKQ